MIYILHNYWWFHYIAHCEYGPRFEQNQSPVWPELPWRPEMVHQHHWAVALCLSQKPEHLFHQVMDRSKSRTETIMLRIDYHIAILYKMYQNVAGKSKCQVVFPSFWYFFMLQSPKGGVDKDDFGKLEMRDRKCNEPTSSISQPGHKI